MKDAATVLALHPSGHSVPAAFTRAVLDWLPWLAPPAAEALTERQRESLVDPGRAASAYFRLLALDPDVLKARTRTDKDIFHNADAGLPRAERELAAAAASRLNGCVYCASVHARFAATYSRRDEDVQRLLDEGVCADLGKRWNAIVAAAAALSATPVAFGPERTMARIRAGSSHISAAWLCRLTGPRLPLVGCALRTPNRGRDRIGRKTRVKPPGSGIPRARR